MPITTLLSPDNAPLLTMKLLRVQLDAEYPVEQMQIQDELCAYVLIGVVDVHIDGIGYGTLGSRTDVRVPDVQAIRMTPANGLVTLTLKSYSADILIATVPTAVGTAPFVHTLGTCYVHDVGSGTHKRQVRELPVPPGYTLHLGETLNDVGAWSSWPDHSTTQDRALYHRHQECFYAITPGYGLMYLDGTYANGDAVTSIRLVRNDEAFVTPLGSHPIVASPDTWLYYFWAYQSFLQKAYNKYASHITKVYQK